MVELPYMEKYFHVKSFLVSYIIRGFKGLEARYFDHLYLKKRNSLKTIIEEKILRIRFVTRHDLVASNEEVFRSIFRMKYDIIDFDFRHQNMLWKKE